jgi:hypothetical protein
VDDEAGFAQAHQAVEAMLYDIEGRVTERDRLARGL